MSCYQLKTAVLTVNFMGTTINPQQIFSKAISSYCTIVLMDFLLYRYGKVKWKPFVTLINFHSGSPQKSYNTDIIIIPLRDMVKKHAD